MRRLAARIPGPVQKLSASALKAAAARWPLLSRLLGMASAPPDAPGRAVEASVPARPAEPIAPAATSETTASLVEALRDPNAEIAARAAEALVHHRGEAVIAALRGVVDNGDGYFNSVVRASAVRSLGILSPADPSSITQALGDVDAAVSLAAIATLAERDESASAGALMGVLEDRRGFYLPLTRHAAARALGRQHHYDSARLRDLLAVEHDEAVRDALASMAT
jgi:HEAT repeat protein